MTSIYQGLARFGGHIKKIGRAYPVYEVAPSLRLADGREKRKRLPKWLWQICFRPLRMIDVL
jgi:hypothetical protein